VLHGANGHADTYPKSLAFDAENGSNVMAAAAIKIQIKIRRPVFHMVYYSFEP